MSTVVTSKGWLVPGEGGCASGCAHASTTAAAPFELTFRNCAEQYAVCRSGDAQVATLPLQFVDLPVTSDFTAIELLALRTSGPLLLRFNGEPARAVTSAVFPNAALAGTDLSFGVDGIAISAVFEPGEDTPAGVAARINAEAALAGASFQPARVLAGQVEIRGALAGQGGSLTAFTGAAAVLLGLQSVAPSTGSGQTLEIDGLFMAQFRRMTGVRRVEASGQASVSVLAAGI